MSAPHFKNNRLNRSDSESIQKVAADKYTEAQNPVRMHLNSIGNIALLSASEEVDLAKRIVVGLYAYKT